MSLLDFTDILSDYLMDLFKHKLREAEPTLIDRPFKLGSSSRTQSVSVPLELSFSTLVLDCEHIANVLVDAFHFPCACIGLTDLQYSSITPMSMQTGFPGMLFGIVIGCQYKRTAEMRRERRA